MVLVGADVNIKYLQILCAELSLMSDKLQILHSDMEYTIHQTEEGWKDAKFEQFKGEIAPYQLQVLELSKQYDLLASQIQETIDVLDKYCGIK